MFLVLLVVGRMHIGHCRAVEAGRGHGVADAEAQEGVERLDRVFEDGNMGEMCEKQPYYASIRLFLPYTLL